MSHIHTNQCAADEREERCRRAARLIASGATQTQAVKRAGISKASFRRWKEGRDE